MSNIGKRLAAQYTLARKERPDADAEAIAVMITSRLGHQGRLDLVAGELDLYPEYSGTAFTAILKQKPIADPARVR